MKTAARRSGYWNREKETMAGAARERYQSRWLGRLLEHAWAKAPGVRRRLERAGVAPKDVGARKSYRDVKHYKRRKRWLS